jgi:hypothetical protein
VICGAAPIATTSPKSRVVAAAAQSRRACAIEYRSVRPDLSIGGFS